MGNSTGSSSPQVARQHLPVLRELTSRKEVSSQSQLGFSTFYSAMSSAGHLPTWSWWHSRAMAISCVVWGSSGASLTNNLQAGVPHMASEWIFTVTSRLASYPKSWKWGHTYICRSSKEILFVAKKQCRLKDTVKTDCRPEGYGYCRAQAMIQGLFMVSKERGSWLY